MTTYAVHAQVLTHVGHFDGSRGVPVFYLDSDVQGIISAEHAASVAAQVVNPLGLIPAADLRVSAYVTDDGPSALQRAEHDAMGPDHDRWCAGALLH